MRTLVSGISSVEENRVSRLFTRERGIKIPDRGPPVSGIKHLHVREGNENQ